MTDPTIGIKPDAVLGPSLGDFSTLYAAAAVRVGEAEVRPTPNPCERGLRAAPQRRSHSHQCSGRSRQLRAGTDHLRHPAECGEPEPVHGQLPAPDRVGWLHRSGRRSRRGTPAGGGRLHDIAHWLLVPHPTLRGRLCAYPANRPRPGDPGRAVAQFSLFPQSNSGGNFQKVAQVITVKISIENGKNLNLVPGMNVTVHIHKHLPSGGGA
jgi:hypothetical protein